MKRASLYSTSPRTQEKPVEAPVRRRWRDLYTSYERQLLFGAAVLLALLIQYVGVGRLLHIPARLQLDQRSGHALQHVRLLGRAEDAKGQRQTASVEVRVAAASPAGGNK